MISKLTLTFLAAFFIARFARWMLRSVFRVVVWLGRSLASLVCGGIDRRRSAA